jgi:hypothetical protein
MVDHAMQGRPCVTNDVIPKASCDLYSYSAWDTALTDRFTAALDHLGAMAPPSDALGTKNVMVGEFGCAENRAGADTAAAVVGYMADAALAWGCPWVVYWQLFDDSCVDGWTDECRDCSGFWLYKPSGERAAAYDVLAQRLGTGSP